MAEGPYDFTARHIDEIGRHSRNFNRAIAAYADWRKHRASLGIPGRPDQTSYIKGYMQAVRDTEAHDA